MSDLKNDPLLARYREASEGESAAPSARVREAVLARARERATAPNALPEKVEAANDRAWGWKVAASVAVIGFTGMVARHSIEAPPQDRAGAAASTQAAANADANTTLNEKIKKTQAESVASASAALAQNPLAAPEAAPPVLAGLADAVVVKPKSSSPQTPPRAAASKPAASAAVAAVRSNESDAGMVSRTTQNAAPTQPSPSAPNVLPDLSGRVAENQTAVARDRETRLENARGRQPEMSTGDAPLAAPAPVAKIAPPAAESRLATEASPAPPIAAAAPSRAWPASQAPAAASAQIAAASRVPSPSPSASARSAEGRIASGVAVPTEPALIAAIRNGDSEALRRELAMGASPNTLARDGTPALTLAAQRGRADDASALLRAGANVNARDAQGRTAVGTALAVRNAEIAALLRAAGAVE